MSTDALLPSKQQKLKKRLLGVGVAIPGTIHALYALCGSKHCECLKDKNKRHGPYYRWHHHVGGRQITIGLDDKEVPLFDGWIKNRIELEGILKRILEIGASYAKKRLFMKKLLKMKLSKTACATRGK
jgi:hypothetical protein